MLILNKTIYLHVNYLYCQPFVTHQTKSVRVIHVRRRQSPAHFCVIQHLLAAVQTTSAEVTFRLTDFATDLS